MFSVDYDPATGIISCRAEGFLSPADVQQYSKAVHDSVQRSLRERGNIRMLVISPETQVQSAETLEAAQRERQKLGTDRRIAVVVSSLLAKLQADRIFSSEKDKAAAFTSKTDAIAWLTAGNPAAHARPAAAA